jgi:tmRNA-binding protein
VNQNNVNVVTLTSGQILKEDEELKGKTLMHKSGITNIKIATTANKIQEIPLY